MAWNTSSPLVGPTCFPPIETTSLIDELIVAHTPVAIGVSGGKDSDVAAFETLAALERGGHKGPRVLIHSDLGRVEHADSRPACERLATRLGIELIVVKRKAGDLMDRWLVRWQHNLERYRQLQCVKMILPWSTPSMRFCTSELKTAVICRDLVERFQHSTILSVVGLRRQESATRAQVPVCVPQVRLQHETFGTKGYTWHPILAWSREDVLAYHRYRDFPLHEAYTTYGLGRVSCAFCMLAGIDDLAASATDPRNHDIYREMVELEIVSTFSFQCGSWLGDVAPHLLSGSMLARLKKAKQQAALRERIEARIPKLLCNKVMFINLVMCFSSLSHMRFESVPSQNECVVTCENHAPSAAAILMARYTCKSQDNAGKKWYKSAGRFVLKSSVSPDRIPLKAGVPASPGLLLGFPPKSLQNGRILTAFSHILRSVERTFAAGTKRTGAQLMANQLRVTLEIGPKGKKVAAVAPDWPGLERGAKTAEAAFERLQSYLPRYAQVANLAGMDAEFAALSTVDIVEHYPGTGSTDFWGISFAFSSIDRQDLSSGALERELTLMQACWAFFDAVRGRVSAEMQKGPRGGGRDRDHIVDHTIHVEQNWAQKLGLHTPSDAARTDEGLRAHRDAYCNAIRAFHAEGKMARTWPLRYLIRHTAYNTLDHAWEMEDKDLIVGVR